MSSQNSPENPDTQGIEPTQIHSILQNERRRRAIRCLMDCEGTVSVRALSERIAEIESGESPPPCDVRKSVYVTLHQNHLSKLEEAGMAERVPGGIRKGESFDDVRQYMEDDRAPIWAEVCAVVSLLGILTVAAVALWFSSVPGLSTAIWSVFFLGVILVVSLYSASSAKKPRSRGGPS